MNASRDTASVTEREGTRPVGRRRYVARGVPGGYRIWDNRRRGYWGDFYELCPDDLLTALNAGAEQARIVELMRRYKKARR